MITTKIKKDALQELAAEGLESQGKDFARLLTAITFWSMGELDSKKFGKDVTSWYKRLQPFILQIKMLKGMQGQFQALVTAVSKGVNPTDDHDDYMVALGNFVGAVDSRFEAMTEIKSETLKFIRQNAVYLRSGSQNSYKFLFKNATKIYEGFGQEIIDEAIPSQLTDAHVLIDTIESLTGRRDVKLTEKEKDEFRVSHPHEYQTILDSRRNVFAVTDMFVRQHIRKEGGMILYSKLLQALRDHHIFHKFPKAHDWDGYVDEDGNLYTLDKDLIKGKPGFEIFGNKNWDPEVAANRYVFTVKTSTGNLQYFYREKDLKEWKEERFEAVDEFAPIVHDVRKKWLADLNKPGKTQVLAVICELLYWASARIGGESTNMKGEKRFGISTLLGRHIMKDGQNLVVDYIGKGGIHQRRILKPTTTEQKKVRDLCLKWATAAGEEGRVFDLDHKGLTYPSNSVVNTYFKNKGATVTVHKLRHARATVIMEEKLKKCPYFKNLKGERVLNMSKQPKQKEAEAWYMDAATHVGKELGHSASGVVTGTTSIAAYVNPSTTTGFFNDLKLRLPDWAKKFEKD